MTDGYILDGLPGKEPRVSRGRPSKRVKIPQTSPFTFRMFCAENGHCCEVTARKNFMALLKAGKLNRHGRLGPKIPLTGRPPEWYSKV